MTSAAEKLKQLLKHTELELYYLELADSTNRLALAHALSEAPEHPVLFVAEEQSAGRGRLGRSFISGRGGIYMTLLLPTSDDEDVLALTTYTAVVICEVLERLTELKPGIKWVNDVYVSGKKLAGILVQGASADRLTLTAAIADAYLDGAGSVAAPLTVAEYRKRSILTGCDVNVIKPTETYRARVVGIGDSCELIVEREDGSKERLSSGDVSIRRIKA